MGFWDWIFPKPQKPQKPQVARRSRTEKDIEGAKDKELKREGEDKC